MNNRPTTDGRHGNLITTPRVAALIQLLGGKRYSGVTLSVDELRAVNRLYGYKPEKPRTRPSPPTAPERAKFASQHEFDDATRKYKIATDAHARWEDPAPFAQAGADRNAMRYAEADGLRLLAWLAPHLAPGEDPLCLLVRLAVDAGWDVDPGDVEWIESEEDFDDTDARPEDGAP